MRSKCKVNLCPHKQVHAGTLRTWSGLWWHQYLLHFLCRTFHFFIFYFLFFACTKNTNKGISALITSFILLLNLSYYKHEFFIHYNLFQLSQSFSIITIFFNYYNFFNYHNFFQLYQFFFNYSNFFQLQQFFSIITILFNFFYTLWLYFYENKPTCKFHHLTQLFYHQNMTDILSIS